MSNIHTVTGMPCLNSSDPRPPSKIWNSENIAHFNEINHVVYNFIFKTKINLFFSLNTRIQIIGYNKQSSPLKTLCVFLFCAAVPALNNGYVYGYVTKCDVCFWKPRRKAPYPQGQTPRSFGFESRKVVYDIDLAVHLVAVLLAFESDSC